MASYYELQTLGDGGWRIESIYTDRDFAIADAERLHAGAPTLGVRVVEIGRETASRQTARSQTVFEASPLVPVRGVDPVPVAPLSGRRRDEIERRNQEMRERRLFRQRIISRIRSEQRRLDEVLRMVTWRSAAIAAVAIIIVTVFARLLG